MQKITPFIWFETGAKEAADFSVKVFGRRSRVKRASTITGTPSGTVEVVSLDLAGQELSIMAAGPFRKINEAISFVVNCGTQKEVDHFWNTRSRGGEKGVCGWLKDRYGVWASSASLRETVFRSKEVCHGYTHGHYIPFPGRRDAGAGRAKRG